MLNESSVSDTQSQSILSNMTQHEGNPSLQMTQMPLQQLQQMQQLQQQQFSQPLMGFQQQAPHIQPQALPQAIFSLPDFEIDRIAARLKETFFTDLEAIVKQKVDEKTEELSNQLDELRFELSELRSNLSEVEDDQEEAEQYSRRNCIRISNYAESPDECTDDIVLDVAKKANVNIKPEDIEITSG